MRRRMKPQDLDELSESQRTLQQTASAVDLIVPRNTKGPAYAGPFMSRSGLLASLDEATNLS